MVDQEDIHRKCNSVDPKERKKAVDKLCNDFGYLSDKKQAWKDLHMMTLDEDIKVRRKATRTIGAVFHDVPDKEQVWEDLHRLTSDKDSDVRRRTAEVLGDLIQYIPDKEQAWKGLHKLTSDENRNVRWWTVGVLKAVFQNIPDKEQAWKDLHRLTSDEYRNVRWKAVEVLETIFQDIPDKEQAWKDLHRLTSDKEMFVRRKAGRTLGTVIRDVPDKEQAWQDLIKLTSDKDMDVRREAIEALGTVIRDVPDKEQAWQDLIKMTLDKERYVRVNAYHSLGRISIYKASQSESEEKYLEELKKAIEFFEKAVKESNWWDNPSRFCLRFYRSFYTIISAKKREAKDEVEKYLSEAKREIGRSENKKLLFEAVENLANALKEVQDLENMDLETKKGELNFYRKYCEQAAELMKNTEKTAPFATKVIQKGLPILDRNLKSLLEEIQEKAKTACQVSKDTDTEEIACAVSREVQKWEIGSQEEMSWYVENLIFTLESSVPRVLGNQPIFDKIKQIREENVLERQYAILCSIIPMIPNLHVNNTLSEIKSEVHEINEKIDCITISLKPGFTEELVITAGGPIPHFSVDHVVTISLQEISYPEIQEDLENIKGKALDKLSKFPNRLSGKIKDYLIRNKMENVLEKLT